MRSKLYVTTDFMRTVATHLPRDEYLRPVTFFLYSQIIQAAMIISPYEAEQLLPIIRDAATPSSYLVSYIAPVVRAQLAYSRTPLYVVPRLEDWTLPAWVVRDLGLFAGRLYFDNNEHVQLCQLLGLSTSTESALEENTSPAIAAAHELSLIHI